MTYYIITKKDKPSKLKKPIILKNGFRFNQKTQITIYDFYLMNYIFNKKITKNLQEIINLFLLYEDDEDGREGILIPKIETLRKMIIQTYAISLTEGEIESYLTKCDKIEYKTRQRMTQKTRSR